MSASSSGKEVDPRKIYGRGFFDGQQQAMERMNNAIIVAKERGLGGVEKKVLDAVPIAEEWSPADIAKEIHRQGHFIEHPKMMGCLNRLVEIGLIRERGSMFQRFGQKPKLASAQPHNEPLVERKLPEKENSQSISMGAPDVIGKLTSVVLAVQDIAKAAERASQLIEEAALEIQVSIEKQSDDTQKLRQLQQLLKSIGA